MKPPCALTKWLPWLGAGATSLVCASPAWAADPKASGSAELSELSLEELMHVHTSPFEVSSHLDRGYRASNSVSASRFDAPISDLPFAIQAFTETFIADQKPATIIDVARYSPGVTYRSNDFNEGNANLAVRGFAIGTAPSSVQTLRDGFQGPPIFDFSNVARLEIVKGPASFQYGQVAPGGVVNIITKAPQPTLGASVKAGYGSYGQYRFESDVTGPAIEERLFYRVTAAYDQDAHYYHPYDAHAFNVAPALTLHATKRLSLSMRYEHFGKNEEPQLMQKPGYRTQDGVRPTPLDPNRSGVDVPGLPDDWNSMSLSDYRRSDTNAFRMWADLEADDHWNLRAGYSHQDSQIDALFSGNLGMANNQTFLQGRRVRRQTYTNWSNTVEAQGVGKYRAGPVTLRILAGAQYISRTFQSKAGQAPNDPALGSDPTASPLPLWDLRDPSTWNRSASIAPELLTESRNDLLDRFHDRAIYAGVTLGLLDDRLLLLAGWRKTWTNSQFLDRVNDTNVDITASRLTPQYGALYKLAPGLSLFSSYAESFVPGSQLLLVRNLPTRPAAPTHGDGIEAGIKLDVLDQLVSGTITYFDIRNRNIVSDIASLDPATATQVFTNVQSGEQRSRGVELDATLSLTQNFQIYLSYSYMDARIVEVTGNDAAILAQDPERLDAAERTNYKNVLRLHDAPLQMSAPHLANLWSRYDFATGPLAGAHVAGGANLVYDQTLLPDTPKSAHQTYMLVSGTLGYTVQLHGPRLTLELTGKNLANEHYRPSQSTRSRPRELLLQGTLRL